jgi:hypothetical protein
MEGAQMFCRIRGYLSTCRKHNVSATEALFLLFQGQLPDFISLEGAEYLRLFFVKNNVVKHGIAHCGMK